MDIKWIFYWPLLWNSISEIDDVKEKHLHISVYDSDAGRDPGLKTVVQEKRGLKG